MPLISLGAPKILTEAGQGATVTLMHGGDAAPEFFAPADVTGTVRSVCGGTVQSTDGHQSEVYLGHAVIFDVGPITLCSPICTGSPERQHGYR